MAKRIRLTDYHVNTKTGFLLDSPLEFLPDYFEPWNRLAKTMQELVAKHEMRRAVHEMQMLDHSKLSGYRQLRLAHVQLGVIASGYVWQEGPEGVAKRLPKCVSVPLWHVSLRLGLKPIVGYADLCLANWKYTENERSTDCMYQLAGGDEGRWFFRIAQWVEMAFAKGIYSILDAIATNDEVMVTSGLDDLAKVIDNMSSTLMMLHGHLSAETFYFVLRPFFEGWGGESNPLPDGLIYEGVSEDPIKAGGSTAAQSSNLQVLDTLLGVSHHADKQVFLNDMRNYMPPSHKQLLVDMENMSRTLTQMVTESEDERLLSAYNKCLESVTRFRNIHIQIVSKYIVVVSRTRSARNNYESLASTKGTGGSDLLPFLKELRDDTEKKAL